MSEKSILTVNRLDDPNFEQAIHQLGQHYGQDFVLIRPTVGGTQIIGTNEATYPGLGKVVKVANWPLVEAPATLLSAIRSRPLPCFAAAFDETNVMGKWGIDVSRLKTLELPPVHRPAAPGSR